MGYALENRRFTPHITLARIKDNNLGNRLEQVKIKEYTPENKEIFLLKKLTLFTSVLQPGGPQYTPWYSCQFKEI